MPCFYVIVKLIILLTNIFILLDTTSLTSFHVIVLYFIGMFNVIDFILYVVIIYQCHLQM